MHELIQQVKDWAQEKGIYDKSTAEKQKLLFYKEFGELAEELMLDNIENAEMELGDVIVCYVNWAHMSDNEINYEGFGVSYDFIGISYLSVIEGILGASYAGSMVEESISAMASRISTTPEKALKRALGKITKRTGRMIDGKWQKDS